MEQTLEISWRTIIKVAVAGFLFYLLFLIRQIVIWFFFALVVALLLEPAIRFLRWLKFPRILAAVVVYLAILALLGVMIYLMTPLLITEIRQLISRIPEYFQAINPVLKSLGIDVAQNFQDFMANLLTNAQESSKSILNAITVFFGGLASAGFIVSLAFFISLEEQGPQKAIALFVPQKYEQSVLAMFERSQFKVSGWFGVRLLACLFVGVLSFVALLLLGVNYAFILSLLFGLLTFIPFIGPTIAIVLAMGFTAISQSWLVALYVGIILTVINEIENKVVTPLLSKKFLDLPPVLVLLALVVGATIFGFLGMLFIIPITGIIYEFLKEFLGAKKQEAPY